MATGDRIAIADKATLDTVNTKVDALGTNVNAVSTQTTNVYNAVNNSRQILDQLNTKTSQQGKDYYSPGEVTKLRYGNFRVSAKTSTVLHSYTGGGIFYGLVCKSASGYSDQTVNNYITVHTDGVVSYSAVAIHLGNPVNYGVITPAIPVLNSPPNIYFPGAPTFQVPNAIFGTNPTNAGISVIYLPKPIKFSQSLQISAYYTNSHATVIDTGTVYYMYEID